MDLDRKHNTLKDEPMEDDKKVLQVDPPSLDNGKR